MTLYTAKTDETIEYRHLSLKYLPGHILEPSYKRLISMPFSHSPPAMPESRDHWIPDAWVYLTVSKIALWLEFFGGLEYFGIVQN